MNMCLSNANRPHAIILTKTVIFLRNRIVKLSQMNSSKQNSTKINKVWCKIKYFAQTVILGPPLSDLVFRAVLSQFLPDFFLNVSKCSGGYTASNNLAPQGI